MKYMLLILLASIFFPAQATVLNGQSFLEMCALEAEEGNMQPDNCTGYVLGIYEAYVTFNEWELIADTLCPPENTSTEQMTSSVIAYIKQQPEYEQKNASSMVLNAMADIYPCK